MHIIENEHFQIHIDENAGCNIMACFVKRDNELLPLMPDARSESCTLDESSFIMAPYSNRIEDGVFSFEGQSYTLERAEDHSIHGDVRQRAWTIVESSETVLRCELNTESLEDLNWPWAFTIEALFEVVDNCFQSSLQLKNISDQKMPAGFGWHPYFSRALSEKDQEIRLQVALKGVYPDDNDNRIPSGPLRDLKANEDFSLVDVMAEDNFLDGCFYGYQGDGFLYWPGTGLRVNFDCSESCKHAVIYSPLGQAHVAFEPVTNANNGVNLLARGDETSGVQILEPGKSLNAQFDMTLNWD